MIIKKAFPWNEKADNANENFLISYPFSISPDQIKRSFYCVTMNHCMLSYHINRDKKSFFNTFNNAIENLPGGTYAW